jgi:hypothetical protein
VLSAGSPEPDNAVVTVTDYHGHDAITQVMLDGRPDTPMVVRVRGSDVVAPGTRVTLRVADPVHAWSAGKGRRSDPEPPLVVSAGGGSAV